MAVTDDARDPALPRAGQDWRILVAVFWVTSMVEGLGVSQIFALLPTYLRQMGVPDEQRLSFIGLFSALIFVVGMPLVPLWGAWADKYSRKVVIVRRALVEAVGFAAAALPRRACRVAPRTIPVRLRARNTATRQAGLRGGPPRPTARAPTPSIPRSPPGRPAAAQAGGRARLGGPAGPVRVPPRPGPPGCPPGALGPAGPAGVRAVRPALGRAGRARPVRFQGGPPGGRAERSHRRPCVR